MADLYNLLVTDDEDEGIVMTSPQIPGLIFGRPTRQEFLREYRDAIRWAGVKSGKLIGHWQKRGLTPNGDEYVIRWQTGENFKEADRLEVANTLNRNLASGQSAILGMLDELEPTATGEYQFVVCLSEDTVGWLVDQLRPDGDVVIAAMGVAGVMVAMTQIATGEDIGWPSLDELGYSRETTMGEMLSSQGSEKPLAISAS